MFATVFMSEKPFRVSDFDRVTAALCRISVPNCEGVRCCNVQKSIGTRLIIYFFGASMLTYQRIVRGMIELSEI